MFYTLLKFLGWGLLLAFIGGCIGWALRALKARTDLARARSSMVDSDELEGLRDRVADLEQVMAERDRLRIQLADVRHADSPGIVGVDVPPRDVPDRELQRSIGSDEDVSSADDGTVSSDDLSGDTSEDTSGESSSIAQDDHPDDDLDRSAGGASHDAPTDEHAPPPATPDADLHPELDLVAAEAVLGKTIVLDDLTVVEGIGPKISELCSGVGVTTWRQLADTDVAELQSILDAAGSRYTVHKPATWSHQAELLAAGRWAEFRAFTEELKGGK